MTRYIDPKHLKKREAIEGALEVVGPGAKSVILAYLGRHKKISLESDYCLPFEEIEESLEELFGSGAALIMHSMINKEVSY